MAAVKMVSVRFVIFLVIFVVLVLHTADCRRGGGGGGRGGSRGGSRGGYRGSSGTRGSSRSSVRYYRGPSYTRGSWKTAAAAGVVFGLASYKTRRMYRSHPNREPAICFNEKSLKNGTLGYFVCPQRNDPDDLAACCGPDDEEYCCKGLSGGAIAGIVIGIIAFVAIVVGCVCYCKMKNRKRQKSGHVIAKQPKAAEQVPLNSGSAAYQPGNTSAPVSWNTQNDGTLPYDPHPVAAPGAPVAPAYGFQPPPQGQPGLNPEQYPPPQPFGVQQPPQAYGVQPQAPPPIGFDTSDKGPMPQAEVSGGLPYSPNPTGTAYPPPQGVPNVPPPPYPQ